MDVLFLTVFALCTLAMWKGGNAYRRRALQQSPEVATRTEYVRRLLKHVERKKIAELAEGQAAVISGTVRAIAGVPLVRAPMSQRDVIGFNTRLLDASFIEVSDEHVCADFELVDESGSILVLGAGLDLAMVDLPYQTWPDMVSGGTEGLIVDGTQVLVFGMISTESAPTDYRDGQQQRVLRATSSFPVAMSSDVDLRKAPKKPLTLEQVIDRKRIARESP